MTTTEPRAAIGLRSERGPVLAAIMLSTSLVALDSTVIATAVPSVVADLGGFSQFPWLFSVYLLTAAVTVPIYGKLADVLGRRRVMFLGIAVFVVGSLLCAVAWTLPLLILARGVQGIGAGAIQPVGMTIIGDLYSVAERARVTAYLAGVWAVSAVAGPAIGGLFSEYLSWRWIFLVNLPLGVLAIWVLARNFAERVEKTAHTIDYLGALLLTGGCTLLILGLLEGGVSWDWVSLPSVAVFVAGVVLLGLFVAVERRAVEPVLPLWVFTRRTLVAANFAVLGVGAVLLALSSYVPTYVQGVLGYGPLTAGLALGSLSIGWPIAASLSGRVYLRFGFRACAVLGGVLVVLGTVVGALTMRDGASIWFVVLAMVIVGLGLGFSTNPTVVVVQSVVGWDRRGVVTGANMFARAVGSAVGVAVFGALANGVLARRFADPPAALAGRTPQDVDGAGSVLEQAATLPPDVVAFVRDALFDASHTVFVGAAVVAFLILVSVAFLPRQAEPLVFDRGRHAPHRAAGTAARA